MGINVDLNPLADSLNQLAALAYANKREQDRMDWQEEMQEDRQLFQTGERIGGEAFTSKLQEDRQREARIPELIAFTTATDFDDITSLDVKIGITEDIIADENVSSEYRRIAKVQALNLESYKRDTELLLGYKTSVDKINADRDELMRKDSLIGKHGASEGLKDAIDITFRTKYADLSAKRKEEVAYMQQDLLELEKELEYVDLINRLDADIEQEGFQMPDMDIAKIKVGDKEFGSVEKLIEYSLHLYESGQYEKAKEFIDAVPLDQISQIEELRKINKNLAGVITKRAPTDYLAMDTQYFAGIDREMASLPLDHNFREAVGKLTALNNQMDAKDVTPEAIEQQRSNIMAALIDVSKLANKNSFGVDLKVPKEYLKTGDGLIKWLTTKDKDRVMNIDKLDLDSSDGKAHSITKNLIKAYNHANKYVSSIAKRAKAEASSGTDPSDLGLKIDDIKKNVEVVTLKDTKIEETAKAAAFELMKDGGEELALAMKDMKMKDKLDNIKFALGDDKMSNLLAQRILMNFNRLLTQSRVKKEEVKEKVKVKPKSALPENAPLNRIISAIAEARINALVGSGILPESKKHIGE